MCKLLDNFPTFHVPLAFPCRSLSPAARKVNFRYLRNMYVITFSNTFFVILQSSFVSMFIPYKHNSTNATTSYDVSHEVLNLNEINSSETSVLYAYCWHYNTNPLKLSCEFFLLPLTFTG